MPAKPVPFSFKALPELGRRVWEGNKPYTLVDRRPHQRRDGGSSYVLTWEASCSCGGRFRCETGMSSPRLRRHCDTCEAEWKRENSPEQRKRAAQLAWGAAVAEGRKASADFFAMKVGLQARKILASKDFDNFQTFTLQFNDRTVRDIDWNEDGRFEEGEGLYHPDEVFVLIRPLLDAVREEWLTAQIFGA